jgi:medium-chain acyl-[acyl-carrier-protein] hydrolase
MDALIDALIEAMADHLDRPCAFFGHSMGAVIAFELAHALAATRGFCVDHLFVSGRRAPHLTDRTPPTYDLPDREFIEELRRLNGTPPEMLDNAELLALMLPLIRADFELIQARRSKVASPLACGITAFGGIDDLDVTRADLAAWQAQTTAPLSVRMFPGDHFFLHRTQSVLLEIIELTMLRQSRVAG